MAINILVNGAFGRMGQSIVKMLQEQPNFNLVGQTGRDYDLAKSIQDSKAQVVIDFTHPSAVFKNTENILAAGAHPVIGTTGLTLEQVRTLQTKSAQLKRGGLIAPNFSLGAILLMKCAKEIAGYMPYAEIIEMHHNQKADSPSGTALRTAELMLEARQDFNATTVAETETIKGARGANYNHLPIHAVRLPGLLAHLQVMFGAPGETITLRHDSTDRICFMAGIRLACEKVVEMDYLAYGLEEIL